MKTLFPIILISSFLYSRAGLCRSLEASAKQLNDQASRIAVAVALFGIILAGIYYSFGRNDASMKMSSALFGATIVMLAPAIVAFIRGLA